MGCHSVKPVRLDESRLRGTGGGLDERSRSGETNDPVIAGRYGDNSLRAYEVEGNA